MNMRGFLKVLLKVPRSLLEARFGPLGQLIRARSVRRNRGSITDAIERFERRWPETVESETGDRADPIFILSAGWRSGSTLLQRLVTSSQSILVWGEPYDHCDVIRLLASSITAIDERYPPNHFLLSSKDTSRDLEIWDKWIGNLYPHPHHLRAAHRMFFETLFDASAKELGHDRWGMKEVRLSFAEAEYLRWLFPRGKFLFLVRNPYHAYLSYRPHRGWYDQWPDKQILTPHQFGSHWRRLALSFTEAPAQFPGLFVRYEDLKPENDVLKRIEEFLDIGINRKVLLKKIGSSVKQRSFPTLERSALRRAVEPLAGQLGYSTDSPD